VGAFWAGAGKAHKWGVGKGGEVPRAIERLRAAFQPSLVVGLVTVPFVAGATLFSWALYDVLSCFAVAGDCGLFATASVFLSVLGLALMFLPGLAAVVFALYEPPSRNQKTQEWGGLR
jgi:hypothetical protein